MNRNFLISGLLLIIIIVFPLKAFSQDDTREDYIPWEVAISSLEDKFNVSFYYNPDWFGDKKVHRSILNYDLDETIERIGQLKDLEAIVIQEDKIVFTPRSVGLQATSQQVDDMNSITIGNRQDYGRSPVANVTGTIRDGKTGDLLPGAVLFSERHNIGTVTNKDGEFNVRLPVGNYPVRLSFVGFEERSIQMNVLSDGEVQLELFESSVMLDEVVVTSDLQNNLRNMQMSVLELDASALNELPVTMGEKDVIKGISFLPGVQSSGEFGTGLNVRGGSSDQNLVLLEGAPVFNSSHLFGLLSVINSDVISGVSLMKAGIPAEYGERASSVLEIDAGPDIPEEFELKGGIGLFNSRANLRLPMFNKKAGLTMGGRMLYSNWVFNQVPDIDLFNSEAGFYDVNALFSFKLNPKNQFSFFIYNSHDEFGLNENTKYDYSNMLSSVSWNFVPGNNFSSTLSLAYSNYEYNLTESDSLNPTGAYSIFSEINYYSGRWKANLSLGEKHLLTFGLNGVFYKINPSELIPYGEESIVQPLKPGDEKGLEAAVYLSDDFKISDRLRLKAGLRLTNYFVKGIEEVAEVQEITGISGAIEYDTVYSLKTRVLKTYLNLEPRLSLRYSIDNQSSLKFSYSIINQYINRLSNTTVATPSDLWKLSDEKLRPLRVNQFALGYYRNMMDNALEFSAETYYKLYENLPEYKNGAQLLLNENISEDLTSAEGYAYGMDLLLKKKSGRFTGWLGYTYSRSMRRTQSEDPESQINNNEYFPFYFDKPHNIITILNYNLTRRFRFSATFNYSTGRPVTLPELKYDYNSYQLLYYSDRNEYRLEDYHRLDLSLTISESLKIKKRWKGSWTISLLNVYGRKNTYSVFYQRDEGRYDNRYKPFNLYRMYIIGRPLPTITYNLTF